METNQLIKQLTTDIKPVEVIKSPITRSAKWLAIEVVYVVVLLFAIDTRFDLMEKINEPLFLAELTLAALGSITACIVAAHLSVPDCYQKNWIKWAALIPFVLLAALLAYQLTHPELMGDKPVNATLNTYQCYTDTLIFTVFPIIVMFFFIRKGATTNSCWAGAMACLSAVNMSYIALRLIEPNDVMSHLIHWHYSPMITVTLIGIILGNRLLRW